MTSTPLTHVDVVRALAYAYPGVEFSYDGDGSTLGRKKISDDETSQGLVWHGPGAKPTLAQVRAALKRMNDDG